MIGLTRTHAALVALPLATMILYSWLRNAEVDDSTAEPAQAADATRVPIVYDQALDVRSTRAESMRLGMKVAALEQRLAEVESSRNAQEGPSESERNGGGEQEQDGDPGPSSEELLQQWTSEFSVQQYDSNWAPEAERTIAPELGSMGSDSGFRLNEVKCKTNGCKAVVEFDSYDAARKHARELATKSYSMNCGTRITLPAPVDAQAPYAATLFLTNCFMDG